MTDPFTEADFIEAERRIRDFWGRFPELDWCHPKWGAIEVDSVDVTPDHARIALNPGDSRGIPNQSLGDSGSLDASSLSDDR